MVPTGTKLPAPRQLLIPFSILFSFLTQSQNHNHMNCNHIFHKSGTITITSIAQSKSTQETSLAITIKKQVLYNQEISFCNHNSETTTSTTLAQSRRPPLPPARRRCPTRAGRPPRAGRTRAGEAARPAPCREAARPRHVPGRPRAPCRGGHALDLRDGPCSTCATAGGGAGALPPGSSCLEKREAK